MKKNGTNKKALVALIVFALVAVVAGSIYIVQLVNKNKQLESMKELSQNTYTEKPVQNNTPPPETVLQITPEPITEWEKSLIKLGEMNIPIPEKEVDFEKLWAETNEDIYAWIYIPDTMIDYPVLQHPTDNLYYLKYNIDGSKGYPGCIYTENYNAKDFSDPMTVMYGHNMKNGSMFAGLHKFEDSDYFDGHRYVYIYTPERLLVYDIYASFMYGDEHILLNNDFEDKISFDYFLSDIDKIRGMGTNRREGVEVNTDSHILTLSTCVANKSDKRYLVQGVLLNED